MQKVFDEVGTLDKKCYEKYGLSEDILMEHAATCMYDIINQKFTTNKKILIVSGVGNNGADGIALARLLYGKYNVKLYIPFGVKSNMAKLQLKRAKLVGVKIISKLKKADIVVDCLFGSGLSRNLDDKSIEIIKKINTIKAYKISCDIPSGINKFGQITKLCFKSDVTITMGALKKSLFNDEVKDFVGEIIVANLGVSRKMYEGKTNCFLLEQSDLKLPFRSSLDTHKGSFGHLAILLGDKQGAAILSAKAAFKFGSGLVTIVSKKDIVNMPNFIMQSKSLPLNTTAICIGMGLGDRFDKKVLLNDIPKLCDADLFYNEIILDILKQKNIILTPHPKEFCSLLRLTNIANISIKTLQHNRFLYLQKFAKLYPNIVLVLKGTNVLITYKQKIYINTFGSAILSKGGSGDVLGGLIASLLAQGYSAIESAISGSLAHSLAGEKYSKNNYSLTPDELIELVS